MKSTVDKAFKYNEEKKGDFKLCVKWLILMNTEEIRSQREQ